MNAPTANRVTMEDIHREIADVHYRVEGKLTLAFVTMKNGFKDIGKSACVDPANFDKKKGEAYALEDFVQNIWAKMGYALQDRLYRSKEAIAKGAPDGWDTDTELFGDFKAYESKPVTRMALMIDSTDTVVLLGPNEYQYEGITFKAYQPPLAGDFICRLTKDDTYHVARAVFLERNLVPGVNV